MSSSNDALLNDHAQGCFDQASAFRSAGDTLIHMLTSPGNTLPLRDPVYYLYHHATELALKALLLSHDLPVPHAGPRAHDIGALFDRCRTKGLLGPVNENSDLRAFVYLLAKGNLKNSYRYSGEDIDSAIPDFAWVREAVGELFEAVEPHVLAWANNAAPGPAKFRIALPRASGFEILDGRPHVYLSNNSPAGAVVGSLSIVNSDGSPFIGTVTFTDEAGNPAPLIVEP